MNTEEETIDLAIYGVELKPRDYPLGYFFHHITDV